MTEHDLLNVINIKLSNKNISQLNLSKLLGRSKSSINRLLNGQATLGINDINSISKILGTTSSLLIAEAENSKPESIYLSQDQESLILDNDLNYHLWNLLQFPMDLSEIKSNTSFLHEKILLERLSELQQKNLIIKTSHEKFVSFIDNLKTINFRHSDLYLKRKENLISTTLRHKPIFNNQNKKSKWLETNTDTFLISYFTEDQIKERKFFLKQYWNTLKNQYNTNTLELEKDPDKEKYKMQVISLIDMEYTNKGKNNEL